MRRRSWLLRTALPHTVVPGTIGASAASSQMEVIAGRDGSDGVCARRKCHVCVSKA